jgi:hypothetical protein
VSIRGKRALSNRRAGTAKAEKQVEAKDAMENAGKPAPIYPLARLALRPDCAEELCWIPVRRRIMPGGMAKRFPFLQEKRQGGSGLVSRRIKTSPIPALPLKGKEIIRLAGRHSLPRRRGGLIDARGILRDKAIVKIRAGRGKEDRRPRTA